MFLIAGDLGFLRVTEAGRAPYEKREPPQRGDKKTCGYLSSAPPADPEGD